MVATAARIERIEHLARTEPSLPTSVEFEADEIEATIHMKREYKQRTEQIRATCPRSRRSRSGWQSSGVT